MGTATGFTADRMLAIEAASVVDGDVVGDNLVLTRHDGSTIPAGNVRGPAGTNGINGDTVWASEKLLNKNAYFEILNGANFATWYTFWQTNGGTVSVETTPANVYEGTQSARLNTPASASQRVGTNVFVSPAFQMIRVRARVKTDGTVTASLNFCSAGSTDPDPDYFASGTQFLPDQARTLTAADGWVLLEGVFIVPSGKAKSRAWVSSSNASGSTVHMWVDAVEVIPVVQSFIAANPYLVAVRGVVGSAANVTTQSITVQEQSKIKVSGYVTCYRSAGTGIISVTATVNGVTTTVGELYFNEISSHKDIPVNGILGPLPAGTYNVVFALSGTSVALDANDFYNVTLDEELPVGWQAPTLTDSGRIYVGAAGAAPFAGSWANYDPTGASWERTFYHKVGKQTMLGGLLYGPAIAAGNTGNTMFTLPVGFRPPEDLHIGVQNGANAVCRVNIMRNGDVKTNYTSIATAAGASGWWTLANICFPNSL